MKGDVKARHIAAVHESLPKSHIQTVKVNRAAKPQKIETHYKLMRKFHNEYRLTNQSERPNATIYHAPLEHKTENILSVPFGDCFNEEAPFFEEIIVDYESQYQIETESQYSIVLLKQIVVECSVILSDCSQTALLIDQIFENHNVSSVSEMYSLPKVIITRSPESFSLRSTNLGLKFHCSYTLKVFQSVKPDVVVITQLENCSIVDVNISAVVEKSENHEETTDMSAYARDKIETSENSIIKVFSDKTPLINLENILWNSIIPQSWIFLFQISDFYLDSAVTITINAILVEQFSIFQAQKPKKIIKKAKQLIKQNRLVKNSLKLIVKKIFLIFLKEYTLLLTKYRWKTPKKSSKEKHSFDIESNDLTWKCVLLKEVLMRGENEKNQSIIKASNLGSMTTLDFHKRYITPSKMFLECGQNRSTTGRKINPHLARIIIKNNEKNRKCLQSENKKKCRLVQKRNPSMNK